MRLKCARTGTRRKTVAVAMSATVKIEEFEGDVVPTTDYFFVKIGEPVPLNSDDSNFDLQTPPSQPLSLSERFRLTFVAHSSGKLNLTKLILTVARFSFSVISQFKRFYLCF